MLSFFRFHRVLTFTALLSAGTLAARAQGTSFSSGLSPSISDPITSSSPTAGFNPAFDASTANLSNASVRDDVSDPTHSQLLGSALSPFDNSYINPQAQTTPQTGIVADARSIVGYNEFSFGGRRNTSFVAGSIPQTSNLVSGKQSGASSLGSITMQGAFTGSASARAAFSSQAITSTGTSRGFSGEGHTAAPPQLGLGAQALENVSGLPEDSTTFYASDPVLSGSNAGADTGPELHGDSSSPLEQSASFFAGPKTVGFNYQYDDGQTPPLHIAQLPGTVFGGSPEYLEAANGFPDSTKGLAGSTEEQFSRPAFTKSSLADELGASPFAAVSEGFAYSPKIRLNPDLHAVTLPKPSLSFEAFERNAQRDRYRLGITISQAGDFYRQDLRDYRRSQAHRDQKTNSTTPNLANPNLGGQQQEIVRHPIIR